VGLAIDIVMASVGAGLRGGIRAGLPKEDEEKNAIKVGINADILGKEASSAGKGWNVEANVDVSATLALDAVLSAYARYDTWFTFEKRYEAALGKLRLFEYGPIGLDGKASISEKEGFKFDGIKLKPLPKPKAPDAEWVRSKFGPVANWF
jgi:hypothetical protein